MAGLGLGLDAVGPGLLDGLVVGLYLIPNGT